MSSIAFIPARSGSKRVKDKNIVKLGGYPLIYYTIKIAQKSKLFKKIFCITDSKKYLLIAKKFGLNHFPLRPRSISGSNSSDQLWLKWALKICEKQSIKFDNYFILRPTSPFRTVGMLKRGLKIFKKNNCHSVRAVELTPTHPGKIWSIKKNYLKPIIDKKRLGVPWHSNQYAALPKFYSQNASLEICKRDNIEKYGYFSGKKIAPLITRDYEGFDINYKIDLDYAKKILKTKS